MRIAQISLLGYYNYGQALQRFALQHTLKKFSEYVEVLWISGNTCFAEAGGKPYGVQYVKFEERHDWERKFFPREAVRQSKFKDFENLHIRTRFNLPYFEDITDEYDFFIVGSDQVWNPNYGKIFLTFVPSEKKIAYAASFGVNSIPDDKIEMFKQGVSGFNYISVREENAVQLVKNLSGKSALWVLDPVLLLTQDDWLNVAQKPTWLNEKYRHGYILTYHLSKLPPPQCAKLAAELDLPVINLMDAENYNHFAIGPAEFVWLFLNASLVFTNSFHGAAFSLLFKCPFVVNGLRGQNDPRLKSFLKLFGLEDRMQPLADPMKIDFASRDEVLPIERLKAFHFLTEALLSGGDAK